MGYFQDLANLLSIEKKEDRLQFEAVSQGNSASERRLTGLCWYPVAIRGQEIGRGDYLTIELERTTHQELSHQFRFGIPVSFFSNHDPHTDKVEGIVSFVGGNKIKVSLRIDELPDWTRDGKLGLDVIFDNNSYQEMFEALKKAEESKSTLISCILGEKKPENNDFTENYSNEKLNTSQVLAVNNILKSKHLSVLHGPPGTGKTTTIVAAISALVNSFNEKILVVAPSNTAVDLLTEKLMSEGLNVVRIGNPARISEELLNQTLDSKIKTHGAYKEIKNWKKQANEYKNLAHKYKRNFGKAEREQRKALFDEAHKLMKEVSKIEDYIIEDVISKANVITATLIGANHFTVKNAKYQTVVIDEAGQGIEPACWVSILKGEKLVLAGDHCQLPPTVKSVDAAKNGLENTLLEKMVKMHPYSVNLLDTQYRMNEKIMNYSSKVFYENKLLAHESVKYGILNKEIEPLQFIDTAGCGFEEKKEGTSTSNLEEASFLINRIEGIFEELLGDTQPSIAIISPYKQQILILNDLISKSETLNKFRSFISVNTIDSFQGQERDAVFISMTRSNQNCEIGFLADTRRMNVAMTRAKKLLMVVGDSATIGNFPFYAGFITYCQENNSYKSAWEYL
jgi:ATP-dependent RNA/DNA helicase IGHMBP2